MRAEVSAEAEKEWADILKTAKALDIDFQSCAGVIIADLLKDQLSADDTAYVSVLRSDPVQPVR
jgi:hypothetical protein